MLCACARSPNCMAPKGWRQEDGATGSRTTLDGSVFYGSLLGGRGRCTSHSEDGLFRPLPLPTDAPWKAFSPW